MTRIDALLAAGPTFSFEVFPPKTDDGRVMFAVPWLGKTILGTTDTPRDRVEEEPRPLKDEVAFILGESGR